MPAPGPGRQETDRQHPLLNDPDAFPTAELLEQALGRAFPALRAFTDTLRSDEFRLNPEWRFYRDGKAWLCKITSGKRTVAWLSVWRGCFKVALYFTEKTGAGIDDLAIAESLKDQYRSNRPVGRLKPLVMEVKKKAQLRDVHALLRYKMSAA
jgi:hypothetical protein